MEWSDKHPQMAALQLLHDQFFQRNVAVILHSNPLFYQLIPCFIGKIKGQIRCLISIDLLTCIFNKLIFIHKTDLFSLKIGQWLSIDLKVHVFHTDRR